MYIITVSIFLFPLIVRWCSKALVTFIWKQNDQRYHITWKCVRENSSSIHKVCWAFICTVRVNKWPVYCDPAMRNSTLCECTTFGFENYLFSWPCNQQCRLTLAHITCFNELVVHKLLIIKVQNALICSAPSIAMGSCVT